MRTKTFFGGWKLYCLMLITALALCITACGSKESEIQEQEAPLNEYESSNMSDEECRGYVEDFLGLLTSMPDYMNADMDGKKELVIKGLNEMKSQGYVVGDITSDGNIINFTYAFGDDGTFDLSEH